MAISFSELWEKCENLHKQNEQTDSSSSIIDELNMKINLYKIIDGKIDFSNDDLKQVKSRAIGEILLTLTKLSLIDDINVYESLSVAYQHLNIANTIQSSTQFKFPK